MNAYQGDLVLDVLEVCRNVRDLFVIKEEVEQTGSDLEVKDFTEQYDAACERLGEVYGSAAFHVDQDLLRGVANTYLPDHLMIKEVPAEAIESD